MKTWFSFFIVFLAGALFLCADQTISNVTITTPPPNPTVYSDQGKITASGPVTIQSGAKAIFVGGGGVTLLPGFTAQNGAQFRATVDLNLGNFDLTDTDLDGLPDAWETLHFGSIAVSNGSGDYDGDGISDADEYRAGTNPTLNEKTQAMPGEVNVVLKMPTGKFQGVNTTNWTIVPVP